jgi:hypothetical protein
MGTPELLFYLSLILLVASSLGLISGLLWRYPVSVWTLVHRGQAIEIRNFVFGEQILVDGHAERKTCVTRSLMESEHAVELSDGTRLRVRLETDAHGRVHCRVDDGKKVIFDSASRSSGVETAHGTPAPAPSAEDPRLVAARLLLADVAAIDPGAAGVLENALRKVVTAERTARATADAHEALGGRAEDTAELIAERAAGVEEMLATLRALHLRVVSGGTEDLASLLASARDATARIAASSEVDPVRMRRAAATRQRTRE